MTADTRHPLFTDEHEELRRSIRGFVEKELRPHADEWEEAKDFPNWVFERMGQLGFLGLHFDDLSAEQREMVVAAHPRTGFKKGIIGAFSAGMRDKPETTFGTMNADILETTVPGYVRPNFCDYIRDSRFY